MHQATVSQVRSWHWSVGIIVVILAAVETPVRACVGDEDCYDGDVCTWDRCVGSTCEFPRNTYGDVTHDTAINVFDLFCILNGFGGDFSDCSEQDDDITGSGNMPEHCGPNGTINIFDLFGVLNAFGGIDLCCTGACCTAM